MQQLHDYGHSHAVRVRNPDLGLLTAAMGIGYVRLDGSAEETLRDAIQCGQPTLVEVFVGDSSQIRLMGERAAMKSAASGALGNRISWNFRRFVGRG